MLPFQNMSGDPEQEYFADGMVEDIITELSRFRELFVIARTSSFTYKGKAVDVRQIAPRARCPLRARGQRFARAGDKVRVTAQLVDAVSGAHLWAERYDRGLQRYLRRAGRDNRQRRRDHRADAGPGRAAACLAQAAGSARRLGGLSARAVAFLQVRRRGQSDRANLLSPGHHARPEFRARPLRPCARPVLGFLAILDASLRRQEGIELAEARLAVSLDDKDEMAHAVLAMMMCVVGEWEESVAEARGRWPSIPTAPLSRVSSALLGRAGYPEEAIRRLRQAMRASPHDPLTWQWLNGIGDFQLNSGEFEGALETYREVIRLRPQFFAPHLYSAPRWPISGGCLKPAMRWRWLDPVSPRRSSGDGGGHLGPARRIGPSRRKACASRPQRRNDRHRLRTDRH